MGEKKPLLCRLGNWTDMVERLRPSYEDVYDRRGMLRTEYRVYLDRERPGVPFSEFANRVAA